MCNTSTIVDIMFSKYSGNLFILISLACVININTKVITVKSCGPDTIASVNVTPCPQEPCPVKKGSRPNIIVDFTSTESPVTKITTKAFGVLAGVPVPYPLPQPDGCMNSNLTCPLQPGRHIYLSSIEIPTSVPTIRLVVKWELEDQNGQVFMCFEFPIVVTV